MKNIIIATKNKHKTKEFQEILNNKYFCQNLHDLNYQRNIVEDGNTFIENALKKCETIYHEFNKPTISDDSGLIVDAFPNKLGIHSARYGGDGLDDMGRNELLLSEMLGLSDRNATYICALVIYLSPTRIYIIQEECHGEIANAPKGTNGFGYDPIFYIPSLNRTMAELSSIEKNKISHRGKAIRALEKLLN